MLRRKRLQRWPATPKRRAGRSLEVGRAALGYDAHKREELPVEWTEKKIAFPMSLARLVQQMQQALEQIGIGTRTACCAALGGVLAQRRAAAASCFHGTGWAQARRSLFHAIHGGPSIQSCRNAQPQRPLSTRCARSLLLLAQDH